MQIVLRLSAEGMLFGLLGQQCRMSVGECSNGVLETMQGDMRGNLAMLGVRGCGNMVDSECNPRAGCRLE